MVFSGFLIAEIVFFAVLKLLLIIYFSLSVRWCQCSRIICGKIEIVFINTAPVTVTAARTSRPTVVTCVSEIRSRGRNNRLLSVRWE